MIPINEIVETLIGEVHNIGEPCVLVRVAGCNLDCNWCDTNHQAINERISAQEVAERVEKTGRGWALVTGGEPLLCPVTADLLAKLVNRGINVLLETNGSIPLDRVPAKVVKSVDMKTPSSGHAGCFLESNLEFIFKNDYVKFVITNRQDFDWALVNIEKYSLFEMTNVAFSPVWGIMNPGELAKWILETGLPIRLSIQLHKIIGIK